LFYSGQFDDALGQFITALQIDPKHDDAQFWSARCYFVCKEYAHAALEFERFLQKANNHPQANRAREFLSICEKHLTTEEMDCLAEFKKPGSKP
jgi:TolA-binding protein